MKEYYIFHWKKNDSLKIKKYILNTQEEVYDILSYSKQDKIWILSKSIEWKRLRKKELIFFTKEFLFLLESGLTYIDIFELMTYHEKNSILKKMIADIKESLQQGRQLYRSFEKYRDFFGNFYLSVLYIGEQSGNVEQILALLLKDLEEKEKFRKQVGSILLYPTILLLFSCGVIVMLLYCVLPNFLSLFTDSGIELPILTKGLLFVKDTFPWILLCLLVIAGTLLYLFKRKQPDSLQEKIDGFIFRNFFQKGIYSRMLSYQFSKYFEILLESGFTFQQIFPILEKTIQNKNFRRHFQRMSRFILEGEKISKAIASLEIFSQRELYFFSLGEEGGNLEEVFKKVALLLEEEIKRKLLRYLVLLEPCIFIVLGLCLALVILGLYLPIFSLNTFL